LVILVAMQTLLKTGWRERGGGSLFGVHVSSEGFDWQVRGVERDL
jgi:hypothetical protein